MQQKNLLNINDKKNKLHVRTVARVLYANVKGLFAIGMRIGITGGGSLTRPLVIAGATSATEPSAVTLSGAGSRHMSCTSAGATGAAIESARADVRRTGDEAGK